MFKKVRLLPVSASNYFDLVRLGFWKVDVLQTNHWSLSQTTNQRNTVGLLGSHTITNNQRLFDLLPEGLFAVAGGLPALLDTFGCISMHPNDSPPCCNLPLKPYIPSPKLQSNLCKTKMLVVVPVNRGVKVSFCHRLGTIKVRLRRTSSQNGHSFEWCAECLECLHSSSQYLAARNLSIACAEAEAIRRRFMSAQILGFHETTRECSTCVAALLDQGVSFC